MISRRKIPKGRVTITPEGKIYYGGGGGSPAEAQIQKVQDTLAEQRAREEEARKEEAKRIELEKKQQQAIQEKVQEQKQREIFIKRQRAEPQTLDRVTVGEKATITKQEIIVPIRKDRNLIIPRTEIVREPPPKKYTRKDIAFKESFEGKKIPEGKISAQGYVDLKIMGGFQKASNIILTKVPEGKIKDVLAGPSPIQFVPSELFKFALFEPAFVTTAGVTSKLTSEVLEKSATKTKFFAETTKKGKGYNIKLLQEIKSIDLEIGGGVPKSFILSEQTVTRTGAKTILGSGKGTTIIEGGVGKTKFVEFDIVGGARKFGSGSVVKDISKDLGSKIIIQKKILDAGVGISGRSYSQATKEIIQKQGIRFGVPEFDIKKLSTIKVSQQSKGLSGFSIKRVSPLKQDIYGTLKKVGSKEEGNVFRFVGQTEKPITSINVEGVSLKLKDINIKGTIFERTGTSTKNIFDKGIKGKGLKGLQKTELNPEVLKSVTTQTGAGISQVRVQIPKISTTYQTPVILKSSIKLLQVQSPSLKQEQRIRQGLRLTTVSLTNQKQNTKLISASASVQIPIVKEETKTLLSLNQAQGQLTKQSTKQSFKNISNINLNIPTIKIAREEERIIPTIKFKSLRRLQTPSPRFSVSVRKGKRFIPLAVTSDIGSAFEIGKVKVRKTPLTTFKISGAGLYGRLKTPKGFKQSAGGVFTEKINLGAGLSKGRRIKI